jgi:uridine kinase
MGADHGPASVLVARLRDGIDAGHGPLVVGLDGRSGSGKSTLAAALARGIAEAGHGTEAVTVIEGDEFYAGGSAEVWDSRSAAQNADRVMDWRRQRFVLDQLREQGVAEWHPFDWESDRWDSDDVPLSAVPIVARTAPVIVLEGAYSCRPELHDLLDLRVLLDLPHDVRRRQLLEREGDDHRPDWDARWAAAEDHYFGTVMTPDRFDLVLVPPSCA